MVVVVDVGVVILARRENDAILVLRREVVALQKKKASCRAPMYSATAWERSASSKMR